MGNYKWLTAQKWFTVLYGDYATRLEAKKFISTLPSSLKNLKPFVKSNMIFQELQNTQHQQVKPSFTLKEGAFAPSFVL